MEKYLEMLRALKDYGQELIEKGLATDEVETMDIHLDIAIDNVEEEM